MVKELFIAGRLALKGYIATPMSYFATMTEAPFVDTLMKLGMGKGPALTLTPALIIEDKIISSGKVPEVDDIKKCLTAQS